jgi:hypothetical protein
MRTRAILLCFAISLFCSCLSSAPTTATASAPRVYHGTASVGDFMTITVNSSAQTMAYTDISNNTVGTVSYTVNADGTYTLNDPSGNLVGAYEVPNYVLLIQAAKTGPTTTRQR